jgi:solute carrier family 15 oligopeptide transporter 1
MNQLIFLFRFLTILGFVLAAIGSGSIRANLNTFGANQFKLPEQADQIKLYFSLQIVFLKTGNLLGQFTSPMLREKVKCFGSDDCYPLAFGTASIAMNFIFLTFYCGKSCFVTNPPGGNMVVKVSRCVGVRMIEQSSSDNIN